MGLLLWWIDWGLWGGFEEFHGVGFVGFSIRNFIDYTDGPSSKFLVKKTIQMSSKETLQIPYKIDNKKRSIIPFQVSYLIESFQTKFLNLFEKNQTTIIN
jgi:hypothetical protein